MNKMISKTLMAFAVSAVCALSANVASAAPVFADFRFDPAATGVFTADKITGNYSEIAIFNPEAGTFSVNLKWTAGQFVRNDGNDAYTAAQTGLGSTYGLYALYSAAGTFSTNSNGESTFNFTPGTGDLTLFLDQNNNTGFLEGTTAYSTTNNGDDLILATGDPLSGFGNIEPNNPQCVAGIYCGGFGSTTTFDLTTTGSAYFVEPSPFYQLSFQSGQLNVFEPVGRQIINGSLDVTFNGNAVPEPASLALLGLGLVGLGLSRRRSKKA